MSLPISWPAYAQSHSHFPLLRSLTNFSLGFTISVPEQRPQSMRGVCACVRRTRLPSRLFENSPHRKRVYIYSPSSLFPFFPLLYFLSALPLSLCMLLRLLMIALDRVQDLMRREYDEHAFALVHICGSVFSFFSFFSLIRNTILNY